MSNVKRQRRSHVHRDSISIRHTVLASLDIERSAAFFESRLGFTKIYVEQGVYGVVNRGQVQIHFWACNDKRIAEATGCRVQVSAVGALYERCRTENIVHPNAPLQSKPWGTKEFAVLDPDGNLVTFHEKTDASQINPAT
jgi:catechol 2,3-dioxygenase-like lactoylglutathione lyase family enzyme